MHFLRYHDRSGIAPAFIDGQNRIRSLRGSAADIDADKLSPDFLTLLERDADTFPLVPAPLRLAPCIGGIGKIIAIGKNYPEHAKEVGTASPAEPIIFLKAITSLSGANDPVIRPRHSEKLDWEIELGVVIGKEGVYIDEKNAMDHVAGYCTANDISERSFQIERGGQWTKGKSADSFCPLGPYFVTRDAVPDPHNLRLWCDVNGARMQDGHTGDMTFKIPFLIHYVSQFMRLMPNDILLTGTPAGVGKGRTPPLYLKPGDILRCGVEGLGEQEHLIINAP